MYISVILRRRRKWWWRHWPPFLNHFVHKWSSAFVIISLCYLSVLNIYNLDWILCYIVQWKSKAVVVNGTRRSVVSVKASFCNSSDEPILKEAVKVTPFCSSGNPFVLVGLLAVFLISFTYWIAWLVRNLDFILSRITERLCKLWARGMTKIHWKY